MLFDCRIREFEREGRKSALLDLLKRLIRKQFRSRRHIIKRCGLTPTESLLYKILYPLKQILISAHPKLFTKRTSKLLWEQIVNLYDSLATDDVEKFTQKAKAMLQARYNNVWLEYTISKIRNKLTDSKTVAALGPAAILKHKTTLAEAVPPISDDDLERVRQISRELLAGVRYDFEKIPAISQKSCLEVPLGEGGKIAALSEERTRVFRRSNFSWEPGCVLGTGNPTIVVTDDEGCETVIYSVEWRNEVLSSYLREYDRTQVKAAIAPGPLKARVITKETAGSQFLEPIRSGVWKRLRRWAFFKIDGPITVEGIPIRRPGEFYVSGDYTAATDGFHPEVSIAICDEIGKTVSDQLFSEFWEDRSVRSSTAGFLEAEARESFLIQVNGSIRQILRETMVGKEIIYPDGDRIHQRRGQLMGNLLSFPVLCIYNFAVWQISYEKLKGGPCRPLQERVRINGDDILFPSDEEKYQNWKHSCDELGMELNSRKTQVSKKRCSLNSTLFEECSTDSENGKVLRKVFWLPVKGLGDDEEEAAKTNLQRSTLFEECGEDAPGMGLWLVDRPPEVPTRIQRSLAHQAGITVLGKVLRFLT